MKREIVTFFYFKFVRNHLINRIIAKNGDYDDESISPVVRQSLQHWGYRLTMEDFEEASLGRWKSSLG